MNRTNPIGSELPILKAYTTEVLFNQANSRLRFNIIEVPGASKYQSPLSWNQTRELKHAINRSPRKMVFDECDSLDCYYNEQVAAKYLDSEGKVCESINASERFFDSKNFIIENSVDVRRPVSPCYYCPEFQTRGLLKPKIMCCDRFVKQSISEFTYVLK